MKYILQKWPIQIESFDPVSWLKANEFRKKSSKNKSCKTHAHTHTVQL